MHIQGRHPDEPAVLQGRAPNADCESPRPSLPISNRDMHPTNPERDEWDLDRLRQFLEARLAQFPYQELDPESRAKRYLPLQNGIFAYPRNYPIGSHWP